MKYYNILTTDELDIDTLTLNRYNIGFQLTLSGQPAYMCTEDGYKHIQNIAKDKIKNVVIAVLNPVNIKTFVFNSKIYTGRWNKRRAKNGDIHYVFCTFELGNREMEKVLFMGFKKKAVNTEPGYTEVEFVVAPTCPLYKEIARKIKC